MREIDRIQDSLRKGVEGQAWHGPALLELVAGLSDAELTAKPIEGCHSIREVVEHIVSWHTILAERLASGVVEPVSEERDWPSSPASLTRSDLCDRLEESGRRLGRTLDELEERRWSEALLGSRDPLWRILHGISQHDAYHAGQIALLKKALKQGVEK